MITITTNPRRKTMNIPVYAQIAMLSQQYANSKESASQRTCAAIECLVGAASPLMVGDLFIGGTLQERLLFTLVLVGACTTITKEGAMIDVRPETLKEAFSTFSLLTDKDIRPSLPDGMIRFAESSGQLQ